MGLQVLKNMRGVLRGRINEPSEKKFTDIELNNAINLAQYDVARRLLKINKNWFAKRTAITVNTVDTYLTGTIPSDCLEIESIITNTGYPIRELPLSEGQLPDVNAMYAASWSNPYYQVISTTLYIYHGVSDASSKSVTMTYIQKPTELSNDTDETIIPIEFVNIIIACAVWYCADKAGLDSTGKKTEYDTMIIELRESLNRDVKKKIPGALR